MKKLFSIAFVLICLSSPVKAWDQIGHRLAAEITYNYLSDEAKEILFDILQAHPRYQQDFIDPMPRRIRRGTETQRQIWLLGRAAFWPDIARGLSLLEQRRFNRPLWHFIDGTLLRGETTMQGNFYLGIAPRPDREDSPATMNTPEDQVTFVLQALDYNTAVLANDDASNEARALAICWVLHLMQDIHQPLHAGALYSAKLFPQGDRGGNGISVGNQTLHSVWDRALSELDYDQTLSSMLGITNTEQLQALLNEATDWTRWLNESRLILISGDVYDTNIVNAINEAEQQGRNSVEVQLNDDYRLTMQKISLDRLTQAGIRTAVWLDDIF